MTGMVPRPPPAIRVTLLARKLLPDAEITPGDAAKMMICVKLARLMTTPNHADSILDIAGYSACLLEIECE